VWYPWGIFQEMSTKRRRLSTPETDKLLEDIANNTAIGLDKTYQDKQGCYRYTTSTPLSFNMPLLGHIVFNGHLIPVSEMFGCFMTMSSYRHTYTEIPENLKVCQLNYPVVQKFLCLFFDEKKKEASSISYLFFYRACQMILIFSRQKVLYVS